MRPQIRSMMRLVMAHKHYLRVTLRPRSRPTGGKVAVARVQRLDRTCARCRALSTVLLRSSRQCQSKIQKLLLAVG